MKTKVNFFEKVKTVAVQNKFTSICAILTVLSILAKIIFKNDIPLYCMAVICGIYMFYCLVNVFYMDCDSNDKCFNDDVENKGEDKFYNSIMKFTFTKEMIEHYFKNTKDIVNIPNIKSFEITISEPNFMENCINYIIDIYINDSNNSYGMFNLQVDKKDSLSEMFSLISKRINEGIRDYRIS
jgi:hypothetical protein